MAQTQIKITQLPSIGSNVAGNTVFPVVNTAGNAITEKATTANIGNFILTNAGTTLTPAYLANLAYSVVNAAQPNITSVGTLNVNTLKISGGTNGYILQTDGTGNVAWVAGGGSGNGEVGGSNSQIQFNLNGSFAGDPELTWDAGNNQLNTVNFAASHATIYGNVDSVNVNATGNLRPNAIYTDHYYYANGYVFGGGGGNGVPGGATTQVQFNDGGVFGGNSGFTFNKTSGLLSSPFLAGSGNGLSNIQGANVSGAVGLATYAGTANSVAGANVSGAVSYAGTANSVAVANVVGLGNIATLALNGSSSQILYGNGQWAAPATPAVASKIANGTSNVNISTSGGPVTVTVDGTDTWTFGTDATLTAPNGSQILPAGNNFNILTSNVNGAVQFFTDSGANNNTWTFDGYGYTTLPETVGFTNTSAITAGNAGNMVLLAGGWQFKFGSDANITLPDKPGVSINYANGAPYSSNYNDSNVQTFLSSGDVTGVAVNGGVSAQYFLGPVANGTSNLAIPALDGNVSINIGSNEWAFGTNGNLTAPGSILVTATHGNLVLGDVTATASPGLSSTTSITFTAGRGTTNKEMTLNTDGDVGISGNLGVTGNITALNLKAEAPFTLETANFIAIAGGRYGVDTYTADGPVTATLPASPNNGDAVFFADAGGYAQNGALTIDAGTNTIMGGDTTMTVTTSNQSVGLFWNGRTWRTYNAG